MIVFFDAEIETMPRDQIEKLQEARILQLVPYVYERSPLVKSLWNKAGITPNDIRSLADYKAKVPFMDKDMIRSFRDSHGDPFGGLACATAPHLRGVGFTSGTTGDPTPLPRSETHNPMTTLRREMWQIGVRSDDYLVHMLFTFREGQLADEWLEAGFRPIAVQHLPSEIPYLVQVSRELRPKALFMLSTPLILTLEQYQRNTGDDLREAFSSYQGAVFGGEPLSPHLRSLVESWNLEIFELSSLGDIATTMECKAHDGMHTWEDMALVEHLDPDKNEEAADGGRGELVVTALADDVGPLIRFRTDDLISFTRKPCSCGRTHGRLKPLGRKGDEMLIQGKSILPIDIFPIIGSIEECNSGLFQLIRATREADILNLRVGYDSQSLTTDTAELNQRVADLVSSQLNIPVNIQLTENAELLKNGPPNKIPRVTKS